MLLAPEYAFRGTGGPAFLGALVHTVMSVPPASPRTGPSIVPEPPSHLSTSGPPARGEPLHPLLEDT